MRYGTSHFVDISAAYAYYRAYGFSAAAVRAKLRDGEISIGAPSVPAWAWLSVIPGEGRYQIEGMP